MKEYDKTLEILRYERMKRKEKYTCIKEELYTKLNNDNVKKEITEEELNNFVNKHFMFNVNFIGNLLADFLTKYTGRKYIYTDYLVESYKFAVESYDIFNLKIVMDEKISQDLDESYIDGLASIGGVVVLDRERLSTMGTYDEMISLENIIDSFNLNHARGRLGISKKSPFYPVLVDVLKGVIENAYLGNAISSDDIDLFSEDRYVRSKKYKENYSRYPYDLFYKEK